jgi:hypothetical protein
MPRRGWMTATMATAAGRALLTARAVRRPRGEVAASAALSQSAGT